jgi:hypothetical protein
MQWVCILFIALFGVSTGMVLPISSLRDSSFNA